MAKFTREEVIEIAHKLAPANLAGISLDEADQSAANLHETELSKANLSEANLSGDNMTGAKYNKNTRFPEDFDPETERMVLLQ